MPNSFLRLLAIGTSLTLAGGYVAYQTGCIHFSRGDAQTVKAADVAGSEQPRQVLISGSKSRPVGPAVVTGAQPTTRQMLISGSKSLVLTPQQQSYPPAQAATQPATRSTAK